MAATAGKQLGTLAAAVHHQKFNIRCHQLCSLLQIRNYAARKGTRERAKKKKVKVEVKKVGFIPHNLRVKKADVLSVGMVRYNDLYKPDPIDDVWLLKYHKFRVYPFAEAIECHRETHHPTCYNLPNSLVHAFIELDMAGTKANKVVEGFTRTVSVPHIFDHGEVRTVMAFAKNPALCELADKAGATISGDAQLVSEIQAGAVSLDDYTAVVAHPDIMPEVSTIRGLMKRKFPNPRTGTLGLDLSAMIRTVLHGIKYTAVPHLRQKLCGKILVPIGQLGMDINELEENFISIIKDVEKVKPKREGPFIVRTTLTCRPSPELFKIDFEPYLKDESSNDDSYDTDDDEEVERSNVV